jgi:hypothetical protein
MTTKDSSAAGEFPRKPLPATRGVAMAMLLNASMARHSGSALTMGGLPLSQFFKTSPQPTPRWALMK